VAFERFAGRALPGIGGRLLGEPIATEVLLAFAVDRLGPRHDRGNAVIFAALATAVTSVSTGQN
jgi:hypothetical protein